jgi:hypothetical protein
MDHIGLRLSVVAIVFIGLVWGAICIVANKRDNQSPEKPPEIKIHKSGEYTLERFDFPNSYLIRITNTKTGESYISFDNRTLVKEG